MAKVKGALYSAEARGKIGTFLVFAKKGITNVAKKYTKTKTTHIKAKDTAKFATVKYSTVKYGDFYIHRISKFADAVAAWQALSEAEKNTWRKKALGSTIPGYQFFLRKEMEK